MLLVINRIFEAILLITHDIHFEGEIRQKLSEYDQEIPQLHTADQPTAPRGRASEHQQSQEIRKTFQVKQPALSSSSR